MKLKYYLRGMGIGIIVTTIILAISFSRREVEISDEEIMARAAALGMVMQQKDEEPDITEEQEYMDAEPDAETEPASDADIAANVSTEDEINTEQEADTELGVPDEKTAAEGSEGNGTYRLVIQRGDVCRVVCETLAENGVIDDAEALRAYLFELGYANSLSIGAYDIPYGLTMEDVAQIIMAGPLE